MKKADNGGWHKCSHDSRFLFISVAEVSYILTMVLVGTIKAHFMSVVLTLFLLSLICDYIVSNISLIVTYLNLLCIYCTFFWLSLTQTNCLHLFIPIIWKPRTALLAIFIKRYSQPYLWAVLFVATISRKTFKRMLFTCTISALKNNRHTCHVSIVDHFKCGHMKPFGKCSKRQVVIHVGCHIIVSNIPSTLKKHKS